MHLRSKWISFLLLFSFGKGVFPEPGHGDQQGRFIQNGLDKSPIKKVTLSSSEDGKPQIVIETDSSSQKNYLSPRLYRDGKWIDMEAVKSPVSQRVFYKMPLGGLAQPEKKIYICLFEAAVTPGCEYLTLKKGKTENSLEIIERKAMTSEQIKEASEIEKLHPEIRNFIELYQKVRPNMKFDLTLYKFATERSKHVLTVEGGHASDLNGQLRKTGYPLDPAIADQGNGFESLYGGGPDFGVKRTAQDALTWWSGHPGHKEHVLGLQSPWSEHNAFGIGMYESPTGTRQYTLITAPGRPTK